MIIIYKIGKSSLSFIKPFLKIGIRFYCYQRRNIKREVIREIKNLKPIEFNQKNIKPKNLLRKFDYGEESYIFSYLEKYFNKDIFLKSKKKFKNIKDLENKLKQIFISKLNFHDIGAINAYCEIHEIKKKIFLIHTDFISYICKDSGVNTNSKFIHLYLPIDDIFEIIKKFINISSKAINFFISKSTKENKLLKEKIQFKFKKIGLIFHESIYYSNLFKKNHYFSDNVNSPLNEAYVSKFVIGDSHKSSDKEDKKLVNLRYQYKFFDTLITIKNFIFELRICSNINQVYGLFFINFIYIRYKYWINIFNGTALKYIIFDYDILMSKSMALAFENLNIKTIAIQERPSVSFGSLYGVIVDTYLFAGKIFQKYGKKNKVINYRKSYNLGMWRLSFFYDKKLPKFDSIKFKSLHKNEITYFKKKIIFLGYFLDLNNEKCHTNTIAFKNITDHIKTIANNFNDHAIILRMKILKKGDREKIIKNFQGINNFFICADYDQEIISYRLCKEADLIISVQTSLAEESLAYGKKVILLNQLFPISDFCEAIYPKEFHFAITNSPEETLKLSKYCLNSTNLNGKFNKLQKLLIGDVKIKGKDYLPKILEKFI